MKQELSEKFVFVIKEKKQRKIFENNVFFFKVEIPQKTDFTVACSIYSFMVFQAHITLCTQFYKINQIMICV